MHKLNKKAEGESPRITLRMDAGCMKIVERVARSLKGDKSQAIRAIVQAHEDLVRRGRDDANGALKVAQQVVNEALKERDDALKERDAIAEDLASAKKSIDRLLIECDELRARIAVPVAPKTSIAPVEPADDAVPNTTLRARWTALKAPLRPFVARHDITRTPFQKWVAGDRDMHGETLAKYEAAIAVEEAEFGELRFRPVAAA